MQQQLAPEAHLAEQHCSDTVDQRAARVETILFEVFEGVQLLEERVGIDLPPKACLKAFK